MDRTTIILAAGCVLFVFVLSVAIYKWERCRSAGGVPIQGQCVKLPLIPLND